MSSLTSSRDETVTPASRSRQTPDSREIYEREAVAWLRRKSPYDVSHDYKFTLALHGLEHEGFDWNDKLDQRVEQGEMILVPFRDHTWGIVKAARTTRQARLSPGSQSSYSLIAGLTDRDMPNLWLAERAQESLADEENCIWPAFWDTERDRNVRVMYLKDWLGQWIKKHSGEIRVRPTYRSSYNPSHPTPKSASIPNSSRHSVSRSRLRNEHISTVPERSRSDRSSSRGSLSSESSIGRTSLTDDAEIAFELVYPKTPSNRIDDKQGGVTFGAPEGRRPSTPYLVYRKHSGARSGHGTHKEDPARGTTRFLPRGPIPPAAPRTGVRFDPKGAGSSPGPGASRPRTPPRALSHHSQSSSSDEELYAPPSPPDRLLDPNNRRRSISSSSSEFQRRLRRWEPQSRAHTGRLPPTPKHDEELTSLADGASFYSPSQSKYMSTSRRRKIDWPFAKVRVISPSSLLDKMRRKYPFTGTRDREDRREHIQCWPWPWSRK